MGKNTETSAVIDALLKLAVGGATISVAIAAPNAVQALDKPLKHFFKHMDARERERELQKTATYMLRRGLLSGDYEHGLVITRAGQKRAKRADYTNLEVPAPATWDACWRMVMFDIPEQNRRSRVLLTAKLRQLGFQPLQQSIWVHPFPCREAVQAVATHLDVAPYLTYIETSHIDHAEKLRARFRTLLGKSTAPG